MPARAILVGFPGMEASLVDRWAAEGTMPAFAEVARRGRSLHLANRQDHLPDVLWPEIFTGRQGATLGWYRLPEQLFSGETRPRRVRPEEIDLTAVWDHAGRAGRVVAALDMPYAGASPDVNGFVLRAWGNHDKPFGVATDPDPAALEDILARFGEHPVGHSHAEGTRCDDQDDTVESYRHLRAGLLAGAETKGRLFRHVLDERDWDLFVGSFEEAHCAGHQYWHHHDASAPWHDPTAPDDVKGALRDVYSRLDESLGHILEGAGDDATVFLLLSHGMQLTVGGWQLLGEVLVRLGYGSGSTAAGRVRGRLPAPVKAALRTALRGRARSNLQRLAGSLPDPLASPETRAISLMNSPCGAIRLNVKGRDPFGAIAPGAEYDAACDELEYELNQLTDTKTGQPIGKNLVRTLDVYGGRAHPNMPDVLLEFDPELAPIESAYSPRVGTVSAPVRHPALPRSGDHTDTSRLVCAGPGIEPSPLASAGDILDVAPTLLETIEVASPETFDGKPLALGAPLPSAQPAA